MSYIGILLGLGLSAAIAWSIGANDMANSISIAVGSNAIRYKYAVLIFIFSQLLGAVLQGYMVMKTLGSGVVPNMNIVGAISSVIAAFLWIVIMTLKGLPISTTHSITSAVIGIGIAYKFINHIDNSINIDVIVKIILSWIVSPLAAMALAILFYSILMRIRNLNESILRILIILLSIFSACSFGANYVANVTGVYVHITSNIFGISESISMRVLSLFASLFIALGGLVLGQRVVRTMAYRITRLDIYTAVAAGFSNAFTVWLFTTVPYILFGYGMPISTTYAVVGSIIGVGIIKSRDIHAIDLKIAIFIFMSWMLTLPLVALLSMGIYYFLSWII
ncbi:phosphate transporter [Ignisphaera aggregans DSM 17230]|uniref:Phosphate transporter n=1 Tax=Ignisphaera aggregans (strain DSM 17230 / JCM 13409 / AQ1.S1) TaxID=583356 RepID=E0SRG3_IGNAA|nr:phosphate transporter [Ignisphaera aggregans DSM 17230]